jgi:site-specific DNA recombinase
VAEEIYQLRDDKRQVLLDEATRDTAAKRVEEMMEFIRDQGGKPAEYDDSLVRKLIEKVTVYDDRINIAFKSGVDVDIEA